MTHDQFPVDAPGDGGNLPARHDPRATHQLSQMRSAATSLALDIQEELRDDEIDLLAYWHILVKRRWMVLSILAGVVALALLITLLTTPVYRAVVLLELQKEGTQVVQMGGVQPADFGGGWDPEFLQTQYKLIQSQSLAERVANELDLDGATMDSLDQPGWFGRMFALLQPQSKQQAKKRGANARQDAQQELMAAAGIVRRGLSVEPVRDSRLVRINYDSTIPGFSVRVANAVAEGFIAAGLERRFGATSYAKTYLEDQLKLTKAKLEDSERKLVVFAQKENLVNTGENGQSLATQNLTDLNAQLATAQGQRIRAEARWRQASGGGAMPSDMVAVSSVPSLRQQRGTLLAQYQGYADIGMGIGLRAAEDPYAAVGEPHGEAAN